MAAEGVAVAVLVAPLEMGLGGITRTAQPRAMMLLVLGPVRVQRATQAVKLSGVAVVVVLEGNLV
jgi:hypothetical protein